MRAAFAPLPHLKNHPLAFAFLLAGLAHALIFWGPTLAPKDERREKTPARAPALELDVGLLRRMPAQVESWKKQGQEPLAAKKQETPPAIKPAAQLKTGQQKPADIKKSETKPKPALPRETAIKKIAAKRAGKENGIAEMAARADNRAISKTTTAAPRYAPAAPPAPFPAASNPKPPYPPLARKRGQEGLVRIQCRVDANGNVAGVSLARSSGFRLLDEAALKTARLWKFRPARKDGANVAGETTISIEFRLLDE